MLVRIIATPPGEAPEAIRRAWVGVVLPVHTRQTSGPIAARGTGVLTGPRSVVGLLWAMVRGRTESVEGYAIPAREGIDCLHALAPEAAAWWRTNAPHLQASGKILIFPSECCEVVDDKASVSPSA